MCELCMKRVENMNPLLLKIITDFEPEYRALEAKVGALIREACENPSIDACIADAKSKGLPDSEEAEQREAVQQMDNATGMALLVGAYSVLRLKDHSDAVHFVDVLGNGVMAGFNEGHALNWYSLQEKH